MGYNQEKVNDTRPILNVLINDIRSGSGEIILEHFDLLDKIYGSATCQNTRNHKYLLCSKWSFKFWIARCVVDDVNNESADKYTEKKNVFRRFWRRRSPTVVVKQKKKCREMTIKEKESQQHYTKVNW